MTGTLWEPPLEKVVFVFVLAGLGPAVDMFVLSGRHRIAPFVGASLGLPESNTVPQKAAVFGGSWFILAGTLLAGSGLLLVVLCAAANAA